MTAPEQYRPEPSGRFAADLTGGTDVSGTAPAPAPVASPTARGWTLILGLVLLVACGLVVRDILLVTEVIEGKQWLPPACDWLATVTYESWMLWAGIACALLALILLVSTVRPRTRTHIAVGEEENVFGRPVDFARMSTAAARQTPGVVDAQSVVTRKKIKVTVQAAVAPDAVDGIRDQVTDRINEMATHLTPTPDVTVTVTQADTRSSS